MKKIVYLLFFLGAVWQLSSRTSLVSFGPGVMAKEEPYQAVIGSPATYWVDYYTITELADFRIRAKVLSKTNYYWDRGADLSPTDLALGWGNMSDESILEGIEISQSARFFRWRVESFPIPLREIETHSANMHLIPANDTVKVDIQTVRKGDIVEISGSLVKVASTIEDWNWESSLTRNDTGKGACELIWVNSIQIVPP